jgi:hypothetical protein
MLTRREFLNKAAGATVTLVLTPVLGACGSSSSGTTTSSNPTQPACDGVAETSTVQESHDHTVCVPNSDLTAPPAAGATYTTSNVSSHTHTITLSAAQLATIASGGTVTVNTSNVVDPLDGVAHVHTFTISKATSTPPPPPPPPPTGPGY